MDVYCCNAVEVYLLPLLFFENINKYKYIDMLYNIYNALQQAGLYMSFFYMYLPVCCTLINYLSTEIF